MTGPRETGGSNAGKRVVLGIGELAASRLPGAEFRILGLGSCVGLVMIDPSTHCVGLAHVALPDSAIQRPDEPSPPARFADLAVAALVDAMRRAGGQNNHQRYIVKLAGGANLASPTDFFTIGKRNVIALRKTLWQSGMGAIAEDVGGHHSRCVAVDVDNNSVRIYGPELKEFLL